MLALTMQLTATLHRLVSMPIKASKPKTFKPIFFFAICTKEDTQSANKGYRDRAHVTQSLKSSTVAPRVISTNKMKSALVIILLSTLASYEAMRPGSFNSGAQLSSTSNTYIRQSHSTGSLSSASKSPLLRSADHN